MKIIKKLKQASMSKNKKAKKDLAKKIDKKILKALKERYLKAKKEKKEAKAAYKLALNFFNKNKKDSSKSKKKKKKSSTISKTKKSLPKKKPVIKKATPAKPKSNASVTTLNQLNPTPAEVAKKLPKTLRVKKQKPAPKSPKKVAPKKVTKSAAPKSVAKLPRVTPKKIVATPKPAPKPARKPQPKPVISKKQMEDLKVVEGVGPAIERLLKAKGIKTLVLLSQARIATLRGILEDAGSRFRFHKPDTWARQARLAAAGKWKQLDALQKSLDGGKKK